MDRSNRSQWNNFLGGENEFSFRHTEFKEIVGKKIIRDNLKSQVDGNQNIIFYISKAFLEKATNVWINVLNYFTLKLDILAHPGKNEVKEQSCDPFLSWLWEWYPQGKESRWPSLILLVIGSPSK